MTFIRLRCFEYANFLINTCAKVQIPIIILFLLLLLGFRKRSSLTKTCILLQIYICIPTYRRYRYIVIIFFESITNYAFQIRYVHTVRNKSRRFGIATPLNRIRVHLYIIMTLIIK
jgi:hypothetical protein